MGNIEGTGSSIERHRVLREITLPESSVDFRDELVLQQYFEGLNYVKTRIPKNLWPEVLASYSQDVVEMAKQPGATKPWVLGMGRSRSLYLEKAEEIAKAYG